MLQKAERLMQSRPDSALALLGRYTTRSFSDSADIAAYALLRTQADDKNYIDHTSDSLIKIAVRYYDRHGSKLQQAQAHYYWGRTFQDRGDDVHTAEQFLTASPFAKSVSNDYLLSNIYNNLGCLLWKNNMLTEADSIFRQLIIIAKEKNDSNTLAISLMNRANIDMLGYNPDYISAEKNLKQALRYASSSTKNVKDCIISSFSIVYLNTNRPKQAICFARKIFSSSNNALIYDAFHTVGSAYTNLNRNDSAIKYLKQASRTGQHEVKEQVFGTLASIFRKRGDYKQYIYYNDKCGLYKDSIHQSRKPLEVEKTINELMIKQSKKEQRASEIKLILMLSLSFIFIVLILVSIIILNRRRQKKLEEARHSTARQNMLEIERLIEYNVNMKLKKLHPKTLKEEIAGLPIYEKLIATRDYNETVIEKEYKKILNDEDWNNLLEEIKARMPRCVKALNEYDKLLTENDIRLCYLIKLEFQTIEISNILGVSPQAVNKRKTSIKNKLGINTDTKIDNWAANI